MTVKHADLIRALNDGDCYAPAHIRDEGNKLGVWSDEADPKAAADTFRKNIRKKCGSLGKPDTFLEYPGQSPMRAWKGAKWKAAFGVD